MPRKKREIRRDYLRAGYREEQGKGDHMKYRYPGVDETFVVDGKDGADARDYDERNLKRAAQNRRGEEEGAAAMTGKSESGHHPRYSMLIEWSDRDNCYVVSFPEWEAFGWRGHTDGKTYQEAAKKGAAMLDAYIAWGEEEGKCPDPALFDTHFYADDDEEDTPRDQASASASSAS